MCSNYVGISQARARRDETDPALHKKEQVPGLLHDRDSWHEYGREQDFAEISRRMYEEIRSSRDPRDHVEDG